MSASFTANNGTFFQFFAVRDVVNNNENLKTYLLYNYQLNNHIDNWEISFDEFGQTTIYFENQIISSTKLLLTLYIKAMVNTFYPY